MKDYNKKEVRKAVSKDIDNNIDYIKTLLGIGETFDIVFREHKIGNKKAASFAVTGMMNDLLVATIFKEITSYKQEVMSINTLKQVFFSRTTICQAQLMDDLELAITNLLSGQLLLFLDGEDKILVLDVRGFPSRAPSESNVEKVTRGSKDSFIENIVANTALIRRRLRDPSLRFEIMKVGQRSQSDIAVAYLKDVTNLELVEKIKKKIEEIKTDGVPMAEKAIEEFIVGGNKFNPLPKVRYTERPDVAAVHILEGHICLIVDTSPTIMILPTTIWHHLQHAEEYHQNPIVGTYLRLIRLAGVLMSLLIPPLWLCLVLEQHILPDALAFLGPQDAGVIPIGIQFLLAEIGVELVRMATIHVPSAQATALGFIGAFMLGEFATKVGLFGNEVIFYTAIAAVGAFATPSIEFAASIRLFRVLLIILAMFFSFTGLFIGLGIIFLIIFSTRSFGIPYLWPLLPLNIKALKEVIFRIPIPDKSLRPTILKPQDIDRLSKNNK
ncbi:spore germination protein [Selenomonadales bacterium OttesenSCG-928-I06]|nr:spore germination protein [Selenomonadales bacterium OttesenSCG-928-I06]